METDATLQGRAAEAELEDWGRALARPSVAFLLDLVTLTIGPLSTRESLVVLAINQANIAPLTRDPEARRRYGTLEAPAPDDERRPVSISAVAASLGSPFETVRRQVRRLETLGACRTSGPGVIVPEAFLASPPYLHSVRVAMARLHAFYRELRTADQLGELPPSAYPDEPEPPIRGAARLLADYILRGVELLSREAGDVVSVVVLLGVLDASLGPAARPVAVSSLSRRLKIPEETVRRHAARLAGEGRFERTRWGLTVPPDRLASPRLQALASDNVANVQRLFAGLAERGVLGAWDRLG